MYSPDAIASAAFVAEEIPPACSRRATRIRGSLAAYRSSIAITSGSDEPSSTRHSSQSPKVWLRTDSIVSASISGGGSWTGVSTDTRGRAGGAGPDEDPSRVAGTDGAGAEASVIAGSIHTARATPGLSASSSTDNSSAVVDNGSSHTASRPSRSPRSAAERSSPDHTICPRPAASTAFTDTRTAPRLSRQSCGSSRTREENDAADPRRNGTENAGPAATTSPRPDSPSGSTDQYDAAQPASRRARSTDSGSRPAAVRISLTTLTIRRSRRAGPPARSPRALCRGLRPGG